MITGMVRAPVPRAMVCDGAEIAYQLVRGGGPAPFARVHSLAMDHRFWSPVAVRLNEAGDVLPIDCRGHGASSRKGSPSPAILSLVAIAA
jgi:3-oxoadipate enol-lactonase